MRPVRHQGRDTTALLVGSAISGLLAYVFFALSTRALGASAAAPLSVLWSYWGFAGAALTFPVQHWIARTVTAGGEGDVRRGLSRVAVVVASIAVLSGAVAWLARDPLFGRSDAWFPVMTMLVTLGSSGMGVVRGSLSARRRFPALGWNLVAENAVRCLAAAGLVLIGVDDVRAFAACLVVGYLVVLLWPETFVFGDNVAGATAAAPHAAFLSSTSLGQLLAQLVLTGAPVVLAVAGGSPAQVTALFAGLALCRAPFIVAMGVVAQLTTTLTGLVVAGAELVLRRALLLIVAVTSTTAMLGSVLGAWIGPGLLQLVFGNEVRLDPRVCALVAAASTFAVGNLVNGVFVLARNRPHVGPGAWLLAVAAAAAAYPFLAEMSPELRVVTGFLVAEMTAFAALSVAAGRRGLVSSNEDR